MSNESSVITLRGSTDIIVDFFQYAITCILYQRGIYPPEDFERTSKYGLALHVAKEEGLVAYIQNVLAQLKGACAVGKGTGRRPPFSMAPKAAGALGVEPIDS